MTTARGQFNDDAAIQQIESLAAPLQSQEDLESLTGRRGSSRIVCLGEASHGTHEYYRWSAASVEPEFETEPSGF